MTERWREILRIMDAAYADYLKGMATLRERVVDDMRRKLNDSKVLARPCSSTRSSWSSRCFPNLPVRAAAKAFAISPRSCA